MGDQRPCLDQPLSFTLLGHTSTDRRNQPVTGLQGLGTGCSLCKDALPREYNSQWLSLSSLAATIPSSGRLPGLLLYSTSLPCSSSVPYL